MDKLGCHRWDSTNVHWNAPFNRYESYFLVLAVTVGNVDVLNKDVHNTLCMLSYFQQHFSFKAVLFTNSDVVLHICEQYGITVITKFSTNMYSLPYCRFMLNQLRLLFSSEHYGYLNSDILLSTELFRTLRECAEMAKRGVIRRNYLVAGRVRDVEIDIVPTLEPSSGDLDTVIARLSSPSLSTLRHIHSADYFVFSKFMDLTRLAPVVVGRTRMDNYLLDIPRRQRGSLVDASFQVLGIHQGMCGFLCHTKPKHLPFLDENWNRFFVLSPRLGFGTLVEADYTFRCAVRKV